jgi:hypothetical protein
MFNPIEFIQGLLWAPLLGFRIRQATKELQRHPDKFIKLLDKNDTSPISDDEILENYRRYVIKTKREAYNEALLSTKDMVVPYIEYANKVRSAKTSYGGRRYMSASHADAFWGSPFAGGMTMVHLTDEFKDSLYA